VVPVSDAREDLSVDVGQDVGESLALLGGRGRELLAQLSRAEAGQDWELLPFGQIAGDPVDQTPAFLAEDLEIDVPGQGSTPRR
jgi:hypothetical protein